MSPDGFRRVGGWVISDTPFFLFELDEYRDGERQMVFVHLRFKKWSASALREITVVFNALRQALDCPLYAYGQEDTPKYRRFVSMFGFTPASTITCNDGGERTLFISLKEPVG